MNMLKLLHQTGRTHRMMAHAVELTTEGKYVTVIMASSLMVDYFKLRFKTGNAINFETPNSIHNRFDWTTLQFKEMVDRPLNEVVLIDHEVIELRFTKMLEQLHSYDLPREQAVIRTGIDKLDPNYDRMDYLSLAIISAEQEFDYAFKPS